MKLLIVSATSFEITPLINELIFIKNHSPNFSKYYYKGLNIDVLITGIGMVPTAYYLGKILATNKYDLAFNLGICGSFNPELNIGELVNVTNDIFSELGIESGSELILSEELKLSEQYYFSTPYNFIINKYISDYPLFENIKKVKGITVNTISGNDERIEKIKSKFKPDTESMEGAAFLHACKLEKINCLQIRAISNYVKQRDKAEWNIPLAVNNLNSLMISYINEVSI
jgi:futalosine hydrolase